MKDHHLGSTRIQTDPVTIQTPQNHCIKIALICKIISINQIVHFNLTVLHTSMINHKSIMLSKTTDNHSTNKKSIRHTRMHTMETTWLLRTPPQERRKMRLLCRLTINKMRIPLMSATSLNHPSWNAEHVINSFSLTTSYTSTFNLAVTTTW